MVGRSHYCPSMQHQQLCATCKDTDSNHNPHYQPCTTSNYAPHRKPTTATDINHIPHYKPLSTMQHQQPMPHYKTMMQHAPLTSFNKSSRPVEDILLNGSCDFCHCVTSLCAFCKLMYCKYKPRPCELFCIL